MLPMCAVRMLGWAEAPTHSGSLPASATNQAAPTSGYLCQALSYKHKKTTMQYATP